MKPSNFIWDSPSADSAGSMPLGNGDLSANVWVQRDGRIRFYLGKTDAWDELGRLVKVGAFDICLMPNPFDGFSDFSQTLDPASGCITVKAVRERLELVAKIWIDANSSTIFIEGKSSVPIQVTVQLNLWRRETKSLDVKENNCAPGMCSKDEIQTIGPDTIVEFNHDSLAWYHHNESSVWQATLEHQGLGSLKDSQPDPLLHRIFGATINATGFQRQENDKLITNATAFDIHILALTQVTATPGQWQDTMKHLLTVAPSAASAWTAHANWWSNFWERSGIEIVSGPSAEKVTEAYALQRFVIACHGRGAYPMKFNGGIFTMDVKIDGDYNPDYRRWGGAYWFQNTRLQYWPLLNSGDFEMVMPLFHMYCDALPLAEERVRKYFSHAGAFFPETMTFWGTYLNGNYGYDREGHNSSYIDNNYIKYYWSGAIELLNLGLDFYDFTHDEKFLKNSLLKLAVPILRFYLEHYPCRDDDGKILFKPAAALETWHDVVNPLPEIAGLNTVIGRLLQIDQISAADAADWRQLKAMLPPIPHRLFYWEKRTELIPAEQYNKCFNSENVVLYAIFPYRLYGIGKPELQTGLDAYVTRPFKGTGGWRQDAIQAALLGLTEEAQSLVTKNATEFSTFCRFPAFWDTTYDWIPDEDHGGVIMIALQRMLIQTDDGKIHLLPAWPKQWDVKFKLLAPANTKIEGEVRAGKIVALKVVPEHRIQDLIIHEAK